MSLIQPLPPGPLDIVGDIHGEYDALCSLMGHLGYDQQGNHPEGRRLDYDDLVVTTGPKLSFDELPGSGPAGYTHLPKKIKNTSPLFSGEGAGFW